MARIRKIEIRNFRSIQSLDWIPSDGINCLIGPGDSGKSTVLDAIDLCLGARRSLSIGDTDFCALDVNQPISISLTVGALPDALKNIDAYGDYLRAFDATTGHVEDEPRHGTETVLTLNLTVASDLEPVWSLVSERARQKGLERNIAWKDRVSVAPARIGSYSNLNLSWTRGSVLNRLSDERANLGAELARAAREARAHFGDQAGEQHNAGVGALRAHLQRRNVPSTAYRVTTIDGFAMRLVSTFPVRSGLNSDVVNLENPGNDYPAIREAAWKLLQAGHLSEALAATYSRLIVDEYQDCSLAQHAIIDWAATVLPTCVLGDPMQAIFGFGANRLVQWNDVLHQFPSIGELQTPWRWRNAGTEALGRWLLACRPTLAASGAIDLRAAPQEVSWIQLNRSTAGQQRMEAARTRAATRDGSVLVIGDSRNAQGRHLMASQTPGATTVEPVDLKDLTTFGRNFDVTAADALTRLVTFSGELMTNVGVAELLRRVNSLRQGRARNPPTPAEAAVVAFAETPTWVTALDALTQISAQPNVRTYRPEVLRSCMTAMQATATDGCSFHAATIREREKNRYGSRLFSRRSVGSTLLLKGLEADVVVILHPELMDAKHLYVALTRGAHRVVVCSETAAIAPQN